MFASFKNQNLKIMATKVFINLPVKDLNKSKTFFEGLGYSFNPQFSDENAACMVISDNIFAMLLVESYFQTFTKKPVSDAKTSTQVLITLDADYKTAVEQTITSDESRVGKAMSITCRARCS